MQGTRIFFDRTWNDHCYGSGVTPAQARPLHCLGGAGLPPPALPATLVAHPAGHGLLACVLAGAQSPPNDLALMSKLASALPNLEQSSPQLQAPACTRTYAC